VDKVWFYYDVDHSGYLDKIETHQFLKHFMKEHNLPAPTMASFNKFFYDHDVNGDGVISKKEMARFFKNFVNDPLDDYVMQKVNEIWFKYDIDRSGYLDKRETLIFLKELLNQHHQKPPTALSFNKWFAEHDLNNDGHISKKEMAPFVRKFFNSPLSQADTIDEMVVEFFDKYDTNRNGVLERREALKMLNEILAR
jgi:Ca2+-binding EF-hand superfamily protein